MEELFLKKLLSKKSQSSVEFIILITFMLVIFTIVSVFVQKRIVDAQDAKTRNTVDQLKNVIFAEVEIAESMPINYSRDFYLPLYLDGSDYTIDIDQGIELMINYRNTEYIYFFPIDFVDSSSLHTGWNNISKVKPAPVQIFYHFNN